MATRAEHYRQAEKLLAVLGEEKDCDWAKVTAMRAQTHALLATVSWEMEERA